MLQAAKRKENGAAGSISGKEAFVLYDTYGFPLEITQELAAAQGVGVDLEGFAQQMQVGLLLSFLSPFVIHWVRTSENGTCQAGINWH